MKTGFNASSTRPKRERPIINSIRSENKKIWNIKDMEQTQVDEKYEDATDTSKVQNIAKISKNMILHGSFDEFGFNAEMLHNKYQKLKSNIWVSSIWLEQKYSLEQ
uniref:Uncharacterized protein n=1 Tax=Rhizophagus irregularis (strain DAOM 181602 / DAOM 197198 / MUCL 43194) TaxID=747089 RepID=U9UQX7_RHIID